MHSKIIADILKDNINKDWLLPSMQREFVWKRKDNKIEKLFDSIMQGYPFGSILTWEVSREKIEKMELYEFVQDYNEDSPHNSQPSINQYARYNLVLDGQQRLSALNIGLKGSYSYSHYGRMRQSVLYLNILSQIYSDIDNTYGIKYEFKFFFERVVPLDDEENFWIQVGEVWHVYNDIEVQDDDKI